MEEPKQVGKITVEQPPTPETVRAFFKAGLTFGLDLNEDNSITVQPNQAMYHFILQSLVQIWCSARGLEMVVARAPEGRAEAIITKPSALAGLPPRLMCRFFSDHPGEATYRAILLYEQKRLNGDFDEIKLEPRSLQ